jgi:hypothetical protein
VDLGQVPELFGTFGIGYLIVRTTATKVFFSGRLG